MPESRHTGPPLPLVNQPQHIAVVDDEADITTLLANYLQGHGFRVSALHSGAALSALMVSDPPALVLLDLGLPGEDGFAVARELRARWRCGLVIVTGRGDAIDKVVGLEVGADDYITKPFDLRELVARCKAVLRRIAVPAAGAVPLPPAAATPISTPAPAPASAAPVAPEPLRFGHWLLDVGARRLEGPEGEVPFTTGEFELLLAFAQHAGRVLSRDFLLSHTRGREAGPFDRTIDVQVGRLRRKLEADAERPQIIKSVRGAGYLFVPTVRRG